MASDTKVLLVAVLKIIRKSKNLEEAYKAISDMVNAESVVIEPYDSNKE